MNAHSTVVTSDRLETLNKARSREFVDEYAALVLETVSGR